MHAKAKQGFIFGMPFNVSFCTCQKQFEKAKKSSMFFSPSKEI
jgi:hypothetical protein